MNGLYILPLLAVVSASSLARAAEPAAAASMPVQAAPAPSAPAAPSTLVERAPTQTASPQSAPLDAAPAQTASSAQSAPAPGTAAQGVPAQDKPSEKTAAEVKAAERKRGRGTHAKPPRTPHEREIAPHKRAGHERVRQGRTPAANGAGDRSEGRNPVLDAINLVATTQRAEIQAADQRVSDSDWWSDTLERDWIVKRPFGPGIFDSTRWFYVSYKVNGRILMSWFVDLGKGTVSDIAPPERQNGH